MTKIIAEIGVNWCGRIEVAKEMILESKRSGADAVKFQMFNEGVIKDSKYKDELYQMILSHEDIKCLKKYADSCDIEIGVSTMYPEAFDVIGDTKLDFIKIREKDNQNIEIARAAVEYCTKNKNILLISTEGVPDEYFKYNLYHTVFAKYMYCIPKYPPELKDINISKINREYFDGYSNHFPDKSIPIIAIARNLDYVEVHVMNKKHNSVAVELGLDEKQIDEPVSITFEDLNDICSMNHVIKNSIIDCLSW